MFIGGLKFEPQTIVGSGLPDQRVIDFDRVEWGHLMDHWGRSRVSVLDPVLYQVDPIPIKSLMYLSFRSLKDQRVNDWSRIKVTYRWRL